MTRTERLLMKLGKMDGAFATIEIQPPDDEFGDWAVGAFMIRATGLTLQDALETAIAKAKEFQQRDLLRVRSRATLAERPKKKRKAG